PPDRLMRRPADLRRTPVTAHRNRRSAARRRPRRHQAQRPVPAVSHGALGPARADPELPASAAADPAQGAALLLGMPIPGDQGAALLLSGYLRRLPEAVDDGDTVQRSRLGTIALDLLTAVLARRSGRGSAAATAGTRRTLLDRVEVFIDLHLH